MSSSNQPCEIFLGAASGRLLFVDNRSKETVMACVYRRRKQYWISYYVCGKQVQKSLFTSSEKVAMAKKRRLEYELSLGDLHMASQLPVTVVLEAFCNHL